MIWPDPSSLTASSPHQQETWGRASSAGRVAILTGGPGTGKTTTAAEVLKQCAKTVGLSNVAVCSPFGKAAVKITASMNAAGLECEATTIHRLLGVTRNGHDKGGWGFRFNAGNPLPYRVLAIEESSTLGVDLGASLFSAIHPGTHVLLLGDDGQLPPVEHGAVLRDLKAAGLPHGELLEIWRNDGDIVKACQAIRAGRPWRASREINIPAGQNLRHCETAKVPVALRHLERFLATAPTGIDPIWDVQVLCTVNEKSPLGRKDLNARLREFLNSAGRRIDKHPFRVGDKVICLSNSMLPLDSGDGLQFEDDGAIEEFVANGEIGRVTYIEPKLSIVKFDAPARTVRVVGGWHDSFDLAYAITTHKSQGSQWPVVIYMSDDYPSARRTSSRQLVYTALSRAEKLCVTIGRKSTIDLDCKRDALVGRKTFLAEMIERAA